MTAALGGLLCVLVPVGFAGLVVLLVVNGRRRAQERRDSLAGFAAQREWRFDPVGTGLENRFEGDPFGHGHSRSASNVLEGRHEGRPFVAFDYSYVTRSGDSRTTHQCSVVAMHLGLPPTTVIPMLQVSPQGSVGRFFSSLFGTDLLIGDPVFDDAFHVRTDTPPFAVDVLHPAMTALLVRFQDRAWRLQGDSLLMFRSGMHHPGELDAVLASMAAILGQVPPHVWGRLRGDG